MWNRADAIEAYGGHWYDDVRLLLRDGTPASGCDPPNDEPRVGEGDEEHEEKETLNPVTDVTLEVRAQLW